MEGSHQEQRPVLLDEEVFIRWRSIKVAEGLATDTDVANILIKQFEKTRCDQHQTVSTCCSQCCFPLPQLCIRCQPLPDHVFHTSSSPCSLENQAPVVYRLLHISEKEEDQNGASSVDQPPPVALKGHAQESNSSSEHSDDLRLTLSLDAKDICDAGKSIIIVDYFSKNEDDVHEMCSEGYIFMSIRNSDITAEDGLRVAFDASAHDPNNQLESILVEATTATDSELQLGNVVTVDHTTEVGDHWIEQLLYGDSTAQFVERHKDTETATAVAAIEALSSELPVVRRLKVKPRRGKDVPPGRIRICRLCGQQCTSPAELKRHMMLHTGEKPFICDECGAAFNQTGNLKKHKIENHADSSRIQFCPKCGIRFALVEDLRHHMRFHSSDRQYVCSVCHKAYATARNLRIHKKTHASDRPWKCVECRATFPSKRKLVIHKATHTGEKALLCKYCDATYLDLEELKEHRWLMHKGVCKGEKAARRARLTALQ